MIKVKLKNKFTWLLIFLSALNFALVLVSLLYPWNERGSYCATLPSELKTLEENIESTLGKTIFKEGLIPSDRVEGLISGTFNQWLKGTERQRIQDSIPELQRPIYELEILFLKLDELANFDIGVVQEQLNELWRVRQEHQDLALNLLLYIASEEHGNFPLELKECRLTNLFSTQLSPSTGRLTTRMIELFFQLQGDHEKLHKNLLRVSQIMGESDFEKATFYFTTELNPTLSVFNIKLDHVRSELVNLMSLEAKRKVLQEIKLKFDEIRSIAGLTKHEVKGLESWAIFPILSILSFALLLSFLFLEWRSGHLIEDEAKSS